MPPPCPGILEIGHHGQNFHPLCWRVFSMCQIGGWNCFRCKTAILGGIGQGGQNVRTAPCPTGQGPDSPPVCRPVRPDRGAVRPVRPPLSAGHPPCPHPVRPPCPAFFSISGCDWRHMDAYSGRQQLSVPPVTPGIACLDMPRCPMGRAVPSCRLHPPLRQGGGRLLNGVAIGDACSHLSPPKPPR